MFIGITEVPDDFLMADGGKRWRWVNILSNTMPPKIRIPLYEHISHIPTNSVDMDKAPARRVAIYERTRCRGKYDEYEYHGDDFI